MTLRRVRRGRRGRVPERRSDAGKSTGSCSAGTPCQAAPARRQPVRQGPGPCRVTLPGREVSELDGERREGEGAAGVVSGVAQLKLAHQDSDRPAIEDQMVEGQRKKQAVLRCRGAGGRRALPAGGEVEGARRGRCQHLRYRRVVAQVVERDADRPGASATSAGRPSTPRRWSAGSHGARQRRPTHIASERCVEPPRRRTTNRDVDSALFGKSWCRNRKPLLRKRQRRRPCSRKDVSAESVPPASRASARAAMRGPERARPLGRPVIGREGRHWVRARYRTVLERGKPPEWREWSFLPVQ